MKTELKRCLKELRLPVMSENFEGVSEHATAENNSYEEYLYELASMELEERMINKITRLRRSSLLPSGKTITTFKRERLPPKAGMQLNILLDGRFCEKAENVLIFGNPGAGKSHFVCAIGHELISRRKKVLYKTTAIFVQELLAAKRELKLPALLKKCSRYDALILDDIGYVQQTREEMEVLFTLFADCYERTSVMLTSNLQFSKWENIFKDPMTTAAAIDRLIHHSVIVELNIDSYRLEEARARMGDLNQDE